jgi:DNA repair and recombination protein RAD54B
LRDIFTIHPHTGCHTHDLLDCPCEGSNKLAYLDPSDPEDLGDSGEHDSSRKGFIPASQINPGDMEKIDRAVRQLLALL